MKPFERPLPHDLDTERAVIGAILRDPVSSVEETEKIGLVAEDFYHDAHITLHRCILSLVRAGRPVDLITVHDAVKSSGRLEDVGGISYLADLWQSIPTSVNVEVHARIVRDYALRRQIALSCYEVMAELARQTQSSEDLLIQWVGKLSALQSAYRPAKSDPVHVKELVRIAMESIDDRGDSDLSSGVMTGYPDLDRFLGGMKPGELIIVGARPSVGKTSLVLNVLSHAGLHGSPSLLFSAEQPMKEIAERFLSLGSGIPMHRFNHPGKLSTEEIQRIIAAASPSGMGSASLWVDDGGEPSADYISRVTKGMADRFGIRLIAVDYLQLLRPENQRDNRNQQIGTLAMRMKEIARRCGVAVILLSQLNREVEHRPDGRPRLADLRESGEIEAHADRVLLMYRDSEPHPNDTHTTININVAKNRNGPIGDLQLRCHRGTMSFQDSSIPIM